MRRRILSRRLILFSASLVALFVIVAVAFLGLKYLADVGLLPVWAKPELDHLYLMAKKFWQDYYATLIWLGRLGAVVVSAVTGVHTLVRAWHYLEGQMPRRLLEFVNRQSENQLDARAELLAVAWNNGGDDAFIPKDVSSSEVSRLARDLRADTPKANAQWLAASTIELDEDLDLSRRAKAVAEDRAVLAHLVRGRYLSAAGKDNKAAVEYNSALSGNPHDLDALSAAAGCERRRRRESDEIALLDRLYAAAVHSPTMQAKALRRKEELQLQRQDPQQWAQARQNLDAAIGIIGSPAKNSGEPYLEKGRLLDLFCEARIRLDKRGNLNGRVNAAYDTLSSLEVDVFAQFEEGGEKYGLPRAKRMKEAFSADINNAE